MRNVYLSLIHEATSHLSLDLYKTHSSQTNIETCLIKIDHACIPFPLARLILSTHSLNALICSEVSSDSLIVASSALRERSISFLVNRKQITLTQRGENLLRPIALVILNFILMPLCRQKRRLVLGYNTQRRQSL